MWNRFMLPVIHYDAYRIGFLKACINYYTYDLDCTIERKQKDCANDDEKTGYTDATLDLTRYKKEIDEFVSVIRRRIHD